MSQAYSTAIYATTPFCNPYSLWQHGSNENIHGLVHQYLPKGSELSAYSHGQLNEIADQINGRPRKGLGVRSQFAVYRELRLNSPQYSTLIVTEHQMLYFRCESAALICKHLR